MKTISKFMAMTMIAAGFLMSFTSCGSDDDDQPAAPAASSVAGTYNGNMSCTVMQSTSDFEDVTFTVTAVDDATVNISVSDFGEAPMKVEGFSMNGVKVSGADGTYEFAATEYSGTTSAGKAYSGTVRGLYAEGVLNVQPGCREKVTMSPKTGRYWGNTLASHIIR